MDDDKSLATRLLPSWIAGFAFFIWGSGLLLLGNGLAGPFTILEWLFGGMALIALPLAVTAIFIRLASVAFRQSRISKGKLLASAPLVLLALAIVLVWNFG